ncbi:MAG: hypothetical protein EZS28_016029, partial [Streblomastix strix]
MSPKASVTIIPAIVEVDFPFEKEYEPDKISVQTMRSKRRSSIFEETIISDPSVCRWLLDIISEDEHMTKESAHFILSEHQLIGVITYTFDVVESQVVLNTEDEGCCGTFKHDGTRTLRDITINDVNILTLDVDKVNLLRDSYKIYLQKVRKITNILDLGDISSKLMSAASKGLMATKTDEKLDLKLNIADQIDAYTKSEDDALLLLKANVADIVDSYSKKEDDTLLDAKADKTDTYTKTETDTLLDEKTDKSEHIDCYTKSEDDALLLLKADKSELIDSYTKTETDTLLDDKADKTDLADYVDLTSAQTISGTKQFNIISVATASKQNKNDASILLAGGGDMLVTSLVIQSQLQVVRNIVTGKSKAYVFSTQEELNDWMAIQDNDGTDLKVLETELPDMSNVVTTLGAVTRSGSAITDISIDGNTLTLAKNTTKSETYARDEVLTKTETNNLLNDKANTGVSYIKSEDDVLLVLKADKTQLLDAYTKSEDDALLLLKADKNQLIDSYTKTETNNLLNNKTDNGVSYIKNEDKTLLFAKADKTQLIDSYSKSETYARDEVYTKSKDDTLLLLKADKTQLIDSYSKSETYARDEVFTKTETKNLLNDKANTRVSYSKSEDDVLLVLKADKTQLIDSYTKTETNN